MQKVMILKVRLGDVMKKIFFLLFWLGTSYAPPSALPNLGNTCFMNALIQAINACTPAREYLIQQGPLAYQDNFFLSSFVTLLDAMQKKQNLKTSLELFVSSACPLFERGAQDDAARLFGAIVDQYKEEPYEQLRSRNRQPTLAHFFEFNERLMITCMQEILLEQNAPAFYLKVPVIGTDLRDGFKGYREQGEPVEFRGLTRCTQTSMVVDLPEIFVVGLNRFGYDPLKKQLVSHKNSIVIPLILSKNDLKLLLGHHNTQIDDYELIAIVMHHGTTVSSGHYTAYIRELDGNDLWYLCDDSDIRKVGNQLKIVSGYDYQEDGYLFFYMSANTVANVKKQAQQKSVAREKALKEERDLNMLGQALVSLTR